MTIAIFNPEHDLCLAKGRAHYVPPRSAVEFALRDASIMQVLYPKAECMSVYDPRLPGVVHQCDGLHVWGWNAVVRHELLKCGCPKALLPTEEEVDTIRQLQHRATFLPLQTDCHAIRRTEEMEALLREREHWVMKAPWSGAGRGLRWVHGSLTAIDRDWLVKTVAAQQCVIAEPRREVQLDIGIECMATPYGLEIVGYNAFRTDHGVYGGDCELPDDCLYPLPYFKTETEYIVGQVERILDGRYRGPLGIDVMIDDRNQYHFSEVNLRHTMGMVAHVRNNNRPWPH